MKKYGKVLVIVLTVLMLVVGLGVGYFIAKNEICEEEKSVYEYSLMKRKNLLIVDGESGVALVIDTKGNAYIKIDKYYDYSKTNIDISKLISKFSTYSPDGYFEESDEMITSFGGYKLKASGVLSGYYVKLGNGGDALWFVLVKEDGKLSYVNFNALLRGEIIEKDVEGLTNVVAVMKNGVEYIPYAIDIYGNETLLSSYIK